MKHERWSTRSCQVAERPAFWGAVSSRFFGRLHVACLDDDPLDASLESYALGPLRMYRIEAPAHRVQRDVSCGALPIDEAYKLVLLVRGTGSISQSGHEGSLRPGDWLLYDPRVPYTITCHSAATLLVSQVPRALLGRLQPGPHLSEDGMTNRAGLHGVLGSYLCALAGQLPTLPDDTGMAISESVLALLGSALSAGRRASADAVPLPSVLRLRVHQHVKVHAADPELSIASIAQALRCSTRYLHKVFEAESSSLERLIWNTRLESAHAALQRQENRGRSVAEIAYGCGFKSAAHFSRLFKSQYGCTPGAFQRAVAQPPRTPAWSWNTLNARDIGARQPVKP